MRKKLERWDAMLLLAQLDRETNGDHEAIDLVSTLLVKSIREYHHEIIPIDPVIDAKELSDIPETAKNWAMTTHYSGVSNRSLAMELEERGHHVQIVGEEPIVVPRMCNKDIDLGTIGFHGAEVTGFWRETDHVRLHLKGVLVDGSVSNLSLTVAYPKIRVTSDGTKSSGDLMEQEFGEVLSLELDGARLSIIVEWHGFSPRVTKTRVYEIIGDEISLQVEQGDSSG